MSGTSHPRVGAAALTALCLFWLPFGEALSIDAAVRSSGQSQLEPRALPVSFHLVLNPLLYGAVREDLRPVGTAKAGPAPIALFATEVGRIGRGYGSDGSGAAFKDGSLLGAADYGVLELPALSSDGAVFAIAGRSPTKVVLSPLAAAPEMSVCPACEWQALPPHHVEMGLTGGGGARFKLNAWRFRIGYGRFGAGSDRQRFVAVGVARSF